jgi:hypothetical protein
VLLYPQGASVPLHSTKGSSLSLSTSAHTILSRECLSCHPGRSTTSWWYEILRLPAEWDNSPSVASTIHSRSLYRPLATSSRQVSIRRFARKEPPPPRRRMHARPRSNPWCFVLSAALDPAVLRKEIGTYYRIFHVGSLAHLMLAPGEEIVAITSVSTCGTRTGPPC